MRYRFLRFPEGKAKAVTLSYDDGCRDDIRFSETISRYGLKCTFNINSAMMGEDTSSWRLTKEEVKEHLLDKGHEIAVNGADHRAPGVLSALDGIQDVLNCRLGLEKMYGRIIRGMAYPDSGITRFGNGASYENIKRYLTDLGIVYSRTLAGDNNSFALPTDWHAWMPTAHHGNPQVLAYIDEFVNMDTEKCYSSGRTPKLFYLWGHSYEFERNNNWDLLETICEKLGGKENIWYATNIEIYDYVTAYRSLVFSADCTMIYNPSLFTVWFDIDGKLYKIGSGETLTL